MTQKPIYLDYAAATPLDERVLAAMQPFWGEQFYNPSSSYLVARTVRAAIETARSRVAYWLGARSSEIIFTAGATESINIAIQGVMRRFPGTTVLTASTEHDAVLAAVMPYSHKVVTVLPNGTANLEELKTLIDDQTTLISLAYANNEIGTIQPLRDVAELVAAIRLERQQSGNTLPLYVHTDASQAAGYLDLHAARLGVDLLTLNGGKIYGPKQTGILYIKAGTHLDPFLRGGGQESNLRSGTENVPGIIGFATSLDLVQQARKESVVKLTVLRDELQRKLLQAFPGATINGNLKKRLPNTLHISWPGLDGERLVMLLDERGVQTATGSACAANKQTASHVLQAIGLEPELMRGSLRLSLGASTTPEAAAQAAKIIIKSVQDCQKAA